ncbi:MAG: hypothetical protein V3T77_06985 [Planctomycetota bacterium]
MKRTASPYSSSLLLVLLGCASLGCAASTPSRSPVPRRPPAPPQTIEYKHRMLKEISEQQRAEKILQAYADRFRKPAETKAATENQSSVARSLQRQERGWPVDNWDLAYEPRYRYHRTHYQHSDGWQRRWQRRYYHSYDRFPLGNTLLYGTLGGILGHQSGHRDRGIWIGAGYGLLRDLLRW